ncbi:MAG: aerobic carbon-monoxide dehydrogenase large subunit [Hyphomicrobiales bacterium]|jgi:carbon-monoxide dehydrogenase large subunit|nr:aerobic carbon-monoxide dehydrogenase large subunit [Hyphomicrobiales bacterium]
MKFGVGQPVRRFEDQTLITGKGRYTDDLQLENAAHAYVARSRVAHANIRKIDATTARGMPGVLLVLTGEDVKTDGLGDVPCHAPLNNKDGSPRSDTPRPALAAGKVRHLGQPVALVIAETLLQAQDAAEAIEIDYETLPAVTDARAALEKGAPQLFDGIPGNLVFDWDNDTSDFAATEAAFAKAAHVTTLEIVNNRLVCNSMEPRNAIGDWDAATSRPVLYTGTQGSHFVRDPLAEAVLKVPKEKLRVITPPNVGGGFGMKAFVYPEQVLVVWAAEKLKRPVRWQSDRSEGFISDNQGRDHFTKAELALDAKGKFLGIRVSLVANIGAYLSPMGPFIPTRSTDLISGLYTTPAIAINVKGVCTNTVPVCAYRGAGRPEASYLIERLVDAAARELNMTPDRIRRINLIPKKAIPYTSPTKLVFDSGEFVEIMDAAMENADWKGFKARQRESKKRGKLRGIGMATYTERCGGGFPETASIEFKGDRVDLVMGNQEYGTGLVTSYKQLVSDRLGIDADRIDVVYGDSDRSPRGLTGGSRALPVAGSALHEASLKIIDKGKQIAANLLEASAADIEYGDGEFRIVGTDRHVDLFDVAKAAKDPAKLPAGMEPGLDYTQVQNPAAATFPNGCHIAEVEIDPDSGITTILRYTIVDDFGDVINPMLLEGQVHGGVVQGIGQALLEETVYDAEGQLLSGTFMDYAMPRADNLPNFSFKTRNVRCTANPLGIKGAGEAGAIGSPPALINAIVDALHHKGVRHIDMPATPSRVWSALHAAG